MQFDAPTATGNTLQSYGPAGFKVSGAEYPHAILLTESFIAPLEGDVITLESLAPLLAQQPAIETLIIGTGRTMLALEPALREAIRRQNVRVDAMDTGAACRTYAVMHSEGRRVGAALLLPQ